jgi:signal transduction histidine kinase/sugar lactone lactonase YvrE
MRFCRRIEASLLLALFLLVPSGRCVHSREKFPHQYSIMAWTTEDGLPDNNVHDILQTRDGFLWIATESGLSRFDGVSFATIDRRTHPILLTNRISTLFEDSKGNLWFGTHGGGLYKFAGDSLSRLTHEMGLPSDYVLALAQDSAGAIWVATDGKGLGRVLPDTVIAYAEAEGISRNVNALYVDGKNTLWIGTADGINIFRNDSLSVFGGNGRLPSQHVQDILEHDGAIWIATSGGLATMHDGEVKITKVADKALDVTSITSDRVGNIWIGTRQYGAFRISPHSTANFIHGDPAKGGDVSVVYTDREGNIWLGTERAGLIRLRDEVFTPFTTLDGLPDNFTTCVTEAGGKMWIGSAGGLTSFEKEKVRTHRPGRIPFDQLVQTVCVDNAGTVWFGTRSGRLMKMVNDIPVEVNIPRSADSPIWAVYADSKGALWVGTRKGLIHLHDGKVTKYTKQDGGLSNDDVRTIGEDKNGTLWFGTSYGLNEFAHGKFRQHTWKTGLSNDVVVSLYADAAGDIWVGTLGGLNRLRNGKAAAITMQHGLPDDAIACILEDDRGYFWIGGGKGISRIKKADLNAFLDGNQSRVSIRVFGTADGLRDVRVRTAMQPTGWKATDGSLWFATNEGVAMIDPATLTSNSRTIPVHIVSVRVDRSSRPTDEPLDLSADHNEVEIGYSAPTFANPSRVAFRYKLEGLSTNWVEAGTRRTAFFSKIPPGEYTFRVLAANEDGVWNETGASLAFVVHPPFWMTWWFMSIGVLMFLSVGPAIYFRRVTQLKRKHATQQEFARRLIASQEAERKRIAAELHDSLGQNIIIIKNRAHLGKQAGDDRESVSEQLDEIAKTATATLDDMRKIAYNLRPLNLERFGLTDTIVQTVKDVGAATSISLKADVENIDQLLPPESEMHLFRIIQEALNNIVKHARATTGSVSVKAVNGAIQLDVRDNGRGFEPAKDSQARGFGLDDIAQRVSIVSGSLSIESLPEKGTNLTVTLPLPEKKA